MATDTQEPPRSPTVDAMGLAAEADDAKMAVATIHGDCQKLKDLVHHQQDPTTMLVVNQPSPRNKQSTPRASMHPLLAAAACGGNLEELKYLLHVPRLPTPEPSENLSQEFCNQTKAYSWGNPTNTISADVEQGCGIDAAVPTQNHLTAEGDTILHLVATNGEAQNFLDCADFIHRRANELLSKENNNDDTPLHCAARAGRTQMVSRLIALARGDGIVEQLLRKENKRKETALHDAVRSGDDNIVETLLEADRELACFPRKGTSPLYLASLSEGPKLPSSYMTRVWIKLPRTRDHMDEMHCMLRFLEAQCLQERCWNGTRTRTLPQKGIKTVARHFTLLQAW